MAKRHIIPIFIPHRGCPQQCVFCDQTKITGVHTDVTPEQVERQIREGLIAAGEGCELAFYGGSFTALPLEQQRQLLEAAVPFVRQGRIQEIRLSTRPDAVEEETCRLLRSYGVRTVELGCQSMDQKVLELSRRGHSPQDTVRAAALLKSHGFQVILQMMTGLPGDTGRESVATAEQIAALRPDGVRVYPTVVLRGTELERMMLAGEYAPQTVEQAVELCQRIYRIFLETGIPVIRMGLNPTEDLSGGEAVAGAYHPAFGELVLSALYRSRAEEMLAVARPQKTAVLSVHPRRVSVMVGQKRSNLQDLRQRFGLDSLRVIPEEKELWSIVVRDVD